MALSGVLARIQSTKKRIASAPCRGLEHPD